ncbi:MAG TPA: HAD family phosphatase [Solirubrobacteraceae bacterium]|nr:HAD family phosphatase [Solirubrobacteraceae bacterium]
MPGPPRRGLLVDYGGVLTTNLFASFGAFCERHGLDPAALAVAFREDREARRALVDFECGRVDDRDFEALVAQRLGVEPDGLIDRLFEGIGPEPEMIAAVAAAKATGVRTGLLSNSWGRNSYDRTGWEDLFDATVISGEVGIRKPDPAIYALAAERLGLPPAEVVFVDDLPHNLEPARDAGMAVVHHTEPAATVAELERLLGVPLRTSVG